MTRSSSPGRLLARRGEAVNQLRNDHHAQHGNQGNAEQNRQRDGERLGNFLRLPLGLAALRQKGRKAQIEEHDDRVQQIRHGDAVKNRHDIADEPIDDSQNRVQPEHGDGKREHGGKDKKNEESLFERRRLVQPALRRSFLRAFFPDLAYRPRRIASFPLALRFIITNISEKHKGFFPEKRL